MTQPLPSRTTRRALAIVAVALLIGLVLGACGDSGDDEPAAPATTTTTTAPAPSTTTTTAPPPTSAPSTTTVPTGSTMRVSVYFMHGDHLTAAHRTLPKTQAVATAALKSLLVGPTTSERAAGLTSSVPKGTSLRGLSIAGGVATVNLSKTFESGGGTLSMTSRLAQVVFTLTQFPTVQRVVFQLDGRTVTEFGGEGVLLADADTRADFEDLMPAIMVESPAIGDRVRSPLRVFGTANVFEALFHVEVVDRNGRKLATKAVMATSGTGTRGTFDTTLSFTVSSSGPGTIVVWSESPKDGSRINVDEVPVVLAK